MSEEIEISSSTGSRAKLPALVVVGRANTGKSTLIATLTESPSIQISDVPGTTTEARRFDIEAHGKKIFSIIDTPGFEDAAGALAHIEKFSTSTSDRAAAVRKFLKAWENSSEFQAERRLLEPVMAGGAILYVVDGSYPYRPSVEAELEILRWTGQPRMALINRTADSDYSDSWEAPLDQYFSLVREISARDATWNDRLDLISALGVLRSDWKEPIDDVVSALNANWRRRRQEAAREIASMLAKALTHKRRESVARADDLNSDKARLEEAFHDDLRNIEKRQRIAVESIYGFKSLNHVEADSLSLPKLEEDLFATETWNLLGLSTGQLVAAGAAAGALTGLAGDAAVGGLSGGGGALIGGAIGAASAMFAKRDQIMKATVESTGLAVPEWLRRSASETEAIVVGPHKGRNFPWVLVSRAMTHWHVVEARTHAQRHELVVPASLLSAAELPEKHRKRLEEAFKTLRARLNGGDVPANRHLIEDAIFATFEDPEVQKLLTRRPETRGEE